MIPRIALVRCFFFSTLLFGLALLVPSASAQNAESLTSSVETVTLGSDTKITITCTISDPQHLPASDFADDIGVSGPDGFDSGGGSAVSEGSNTVIVEHEMAVPPYVGTYTSTCLGLSVRFNVAPSIQGFLYSKYVVGGLANNPQDGTPVYTPGANWSGFGNIQNSAKRKP